MSDFRVGVSSWTFAWALGVAGYEPVPHPLTVFDLVDKAAELGAGVLQIADNLPLSALSPGELDLLGQRALEKGLALEVGTRGLDPDNLFRYLEIAQRLGAKLVRTLPHNGRDRPDMKEAGRRLGAVLPAFEKAGVVLGVENHDFYPAVWVRDLVQLFPDSALGVCLDPVNNLGQGEGEGEVMAQLAPLAVNFHCKDYIIRRKPSMLGFDVEGAPLGQGMLNLDRARALLPAGLSWVIELWTPWQGNIAATLSLESLWAAESVRMLHLRLGGRKSLKDSS
ncbi:sugar phosphate isomerase/epimerase [Paenibacillus sp. YN15]|uniref:sugar phosphate isomerase/epimerase family protein n=1 Tax=Paenibacillus sp. YN15 TaxID=1742774 RepID=UPI000DCCC4E6|nr:TIM barrel protein [Paenibacillus sp. YN15]RAV00139.1 hypothetical protein DQG13_14385 [Paenibacillus sp. YN15]